MTITAENTKGGMTLCSTTEEKVIIQWGINAANIEDPYHQLQATISEKTIDKIPIQNNTQILGTLNTAITITENRNEKSKMIGIIIIRIVLRKDTHQEGIPQEMRGKDKDTLKIENTMKILSTKVEEDMNSEDKIIIEKRKNTMTILLAGIRTKWIDTTTKELKKIKDIKESMRMNTSTNDTDNKEALEVQSTIDKTALTITIATKDP